MWQNEGKRRKKRENKEEKNKKGRETGEGETRYNGIDEEETEENE